MRKIVLTCAMLGAFVALSTPKAEAQFCFKFTSFCDGIQVNSVSGGNINASWYHYDCANSTPMTSGTKAEFNPYLNACPGGNGGGLVKCVNCGGFGDWYFVIDGPLDGTFDMANGQYPNGVCWIDQLAYNIQLGSCTGLRQPGEGPQQAQDRSSVQ